MEREAGADVVPGFLRAPYATDTLLPPNYFSTHMNLSQSPEDNRLATTRTFGTNLLSYRL
jgi:hypothetical protein